MLPSRAATPSYWCCCCRCIRFVRVRREDAIACPDCHGGFLEELASPSPRFPIAAEPGHGRISSADLTTDGSAPAPALPPRTSELNPVILLRSLSRGGHDEHIPSAAITSFELYYDDGTGSGLRPLPESISDFLMRSGFDRLLQQLAQIEINGTGRERRWDHPPASKVAIESMPTIEITVDHIGKDCHCAICKDPFELGAEARELPCEHIYHQDCIFPWLSMRNSCPVCRRQVPAETEERDAEPPAISSADEETAGLTIWSLPGVGFAGGGRRAGDPEVPVVFTGDGAPRRRNHSGVFSAVRNFFSFLRPSSSRLSSETDPAPSDRFLRT